MIMKKTTSNIATAWASLRSEITVPPTALEIISNHASITAARGQRVYRHDPLQEYKHAKRRAAAKRARHSA
jgi:hypothetical protein